MASLQAIQTFSVGNPVLKQRFAAARLQGAWDILAEASPSAARVAWRLKIFNDLMKDLEREYTWFLSHSLVQTKGDAMTDAEVVIATKSFIDAWAAVT